MIWLDVVDYGDWQNVKIIIVLMLSDQKNNVERVQQLIRFHEPISRLECRLGLEGVLKSLKIWEKIPVEYDIFSIVDAIAKRG